MALIAWLPYTQDGRQQGLGSNVSVSGNISLDNNGKLGKCLNSANDVTITTNHSFGKIWSYCFWGYVISSSVTTNWTKIAKIGDGGDDLRIEVCPASYNLGTCCYCVSNNASYVITNEAIWSPSPGYYDKWVHFCITSDGTTITEYIDGIEIGTAVYNGAGTINGVFVLNNNNIIKKNDVRIYDHCLTPEEVKKIAQGLVLHYPLNNGGWRRENLSPGGGIYTYDFPWTTTKNDVDGWTFIPDSGFEAIPGETYTISVESDGTLINTHDISGADPENKWWTFWVYICNVDTTQNWQAGGYDSPVLLTNNNNNYRKIGNTHVWTITLSDTQKYISLRTNSYSNGTDNVTINWWNIKVEKGENFTSWCPNKYSSLVKASTYDNQIYTESDGSKWLHIIHHNNPAGGLFDSTDSFSSKVYKDGWRWYEAETIFNLISKYEFMIKQKPTSNDVETKYRWIQDVNPIGATYGQVAPNAVTRIITDGYTDGTFGGLYVTDNNARLCIANSNNGNWYGALGCWTAYQGGIPGYPNTVITTGYIDLYIRIDNLDNIEYDISGYCNNGIRSESITWIKDTPKYAVSTVFNGTNSYIKVIDNNWAASGTEYLTVNLWVKASTWLNNSRIFSCTESGGFNVELGDEGYWRFPVCTYTTSDKSAYSYLYDSSAIDLNNLISNKWYMFTFIYTTEGTKIYIDGQLYHTYPTVSYGIYFNPNARLFLGCEASAANPSSPYFKGQESDFRIYATALSAEDILELYQNSNLSNS